MTKKNQQLGIEHIASAKVSNIPVSTKHSVEISGYLRYKNTSFAKEFLEDVIALKKAVPFKKHKKNIGHRKGKIAAGRYPIKAVQEVLNLLNSLEANAQNKGLNTESLYISSIIPNFAARPWHYGRQRRVKMKRTHLKITAEEKEVKKTKKKEQPKETKKQEDKKTK